MDFENPFAPTPVETTVLRLLSRAACGVLIQPTRVVAFLLADENQVELGDFERAFHRLTEHFPGSQVEVLTLSSHVAPGAMEVVLVTGPGRP